MEQGICHSVCVCVCVCVCVEVVFENIAFLTVPHPARPTNQFKQVFFPAAHATFCFANA
jgi:hypothetical protein